MHVHDGAQLTEPDPLWSRLGELVLTAVALAGSVASGALLFSLATASQNSFQELLLKVALPAIALLVLILIGAVALRWSRLSTGIMVGAAAGAIATLALEAVRITGFRAFGSMPGDLPTLMGMRAADRMMMGPSTWSTLLGYADHFWNGAAFGVTYALLVGGFPRRWGAWAGAVLGAGYGLALGFGFVTGPVPLSLGVGGVFATVSESTFQTTAYLAHLAFGVVLGALVHRFGRQLSPLWTPTFALWRPADA